MQNTDSSSDPESFSLHSFVPEYRERERDREIERERERGGDDDDDEDGQWRLSRYSF